MSSFRDHIQEDRRLQILRLLSQTNGYDLNASIIQAALSDLGHHPSNDVLESELVWLEEQGLTTTHSSAGVTVSELTPRGADVAAGRANVPGVMRPRPGE